MEADGNSTSDNDAPTRRNVLKLAGATAVTGIAAYTAAPAEDAAVDDDCMEDIEAAKAYADGKLCTEQFARMRCPYDEEVTYGAANGCEISYLQGEGWDIVSPRDGSFTAVLDRMEEGGDHTTRAVLLLEEDGTVVDDYVAEQDLLPEEARHEDAVLDVTLHEGELVAAEYLEEETAERKQEAADRFDRLSERLGDVDEDEDA